MRSWEEQEKTAAEARLKSLEMLEGHTRVLPQPESGTWPGGVNIWKVTDELWRMGRNNWMSSAGWQAATDQGIVQNVDLRAAGETAKPRPTDPPAVAAAGMSVLQLPLEDPTTPEYLQLCVQEQIPYPNSAKYYPQLLAWFGPKITAILNVITQAEGPVVINCSAGRDRTGLISSLVLLLSGADDAEILGVHAASCAGINAWHLVSQLPHPHEFGRSGALYHEWLEGHLSQMQEFLNWYRTTDYRQDLVAAGLHRESLEVLLPS